MTSNLPSDSAEPLSKKPVFDTLASEIKDLTSQKLLEDLSDLQQVNKDLTKKVQHLKCLNNQLTVRNKKLQEQNHHLRQQLKLHEPKRCRQTLKRKIKSTKLWRDKFWDLHRTTKNSEKQLVDMKVELRKVRKSKRKQTARLSKKLDCMRESALDTECRMAVDMADAQKASQAELRVMENELAMSKVHHYIMNKGANITVTTDADYSVTFCHKWHCYCKLHDL